MSLEELLKSLQKDYVASLPAKLTSIREQISANDSTLLRDSFHKLKGTGRTYGLPEISDVAAVVERICVVSPQASAVAADLAVQILDDIFKARQAQNAFDVLPDPRFAQIRSLLPS